MRPKNGKIQSWKEEKWSIARGRDKNKYSPRTSLSLDPEIERIKKLARAEGNAELKVIFHQTQIWDGREKHLSRLDFLTLPAAHAGRAQTFAIRTFVSSWGKSVR